MNILIGVAIGLLILMSLVTAHEFGHFLMARKNGVKVLEFGICFPPRALAWKKGKDGKWHRLPKSKWDKPQDSLIFSLNWLPIGGFCQMDGETAIDQRKGTFGHASFKAKTKILFGGVAMNWLISFVLLTFLAWAGMPKLVDDQFTIRQDTGITYDERFVTPMEIRHSTWSAPIVGAGLTLQLTGKTFVGVGRLLWNLASGIIGQFTFDSGIREQANANLSAAGDSVTGPVGIVGSIFPSFVAAGPATLTFLTSIISISLACMNVLPIPALDGGRWLLMAIYKLRKKPLTPEIEAKIVAHAFTVLLILIAIVTILDITRLF